MRTSIRCSRATVFCIVCWLALLSAIPARGAVFPLTVTDAAQKQVQFTAAPQRVVCLVSAVSEMLVAFGQEKVLVGLTRQDAIINSGLRVSNVGGYFSPDVDAIALAHPDVIIAAPSHTEVIRRFHNSDCKVLVMATNSIEGAFNQMAMIGRLFTCEAKATAVIQHNREQLALVKAKLADVPAAKKKRVVRAMAGDALFCPGDDSFQNEIITAAGGIPPQWGKKGFAVPVGLEAWQRFNPQFVFGCNDNAKEVEALLHREGWKAVDAVRTGAVTMFPCRLTCQVSTQVGAFVQWLAASLYLDIFADPAHALSSNRVLRERPVALDLPYVQQAQVVTHQVADEEYKSLVVRFKQPQEILSTSEGRLSGLRAVGNTYVPMQASLGHMAFGVEQVRKDIAKNVGYAAHEYTGMMTGADMDNLSVQQQRFKDLEVTALVTAGVRGNGQRMSKDTGGEHTLGTINILLLTNRRLTSEAMARAIITATEAKTAALLDMDIRSTYTSGEHRATGTGTDSMIVVQGEGPEVHYTGGHGKIGELIAKAVHAGVTEAIFKQNGIKVDRDVLQRLAERKMNLEQIVRLYAGKGKGTKTLVSRLEGVLKQSYYAGFVESALAISDDYGKGLLKDLTFFDTMCRSVVTRLSGGRPDLSVADLPAPDGLPVVMARAFGALIIGLSETDEKGTKL